MCSKAESVRDQAIVVGILDWQAADKQCATMLLYSFKQSSRRAQGLNVLCCLVDCGPPVGIDFQREWKSMVILIAQCTRASLALKAKFFKLWKYHCHNVLFGSLKCRKLVIRDASS
jgi:hypothetical protein